MDLDVIFDKLVGGASNPCPKALVSEEARVGTIQGLVDFNPRHNCFCCRGQGSHYFSAGLGNDCLSAANPPHKFG